MGPAVTARDWSVPAELTSWIIGLRAAAVLSMLALLLAGRAFAQLPIPRTPVLAVIAAALLYNVALAVAARRANAQPAPTADRLRAWILYVGGVLDIGALALLVLFTGGLVSPWLYFFIAGNVGALAILPPTPGRVLTVVNTLAALAVVAWPVFDHTPLPGAAMAAHLSASPAYAIVVAVSLIGLMGLTANAVNIPVREARGAARFQEGLAQIAVAVQGARGDVGQVLAAVCRHAHDWFGAECTVIALLEGEDLVVMAVEGGAAAALIHQRLPVRRPRSLEVEVLRRRAGFYVNHRHRPPHAGLSALAGAPDDAVLAVPLVSSLGVLGVLTLSAPGGRFSNTVLQRASILAVQAGVAVENARLLDRVREEADSVTALLQASEHLTKSVDLPTLLTDLNQIAAATTRCDRSTTFLWDARREVFYFGSTFGNTPEFVATIRHLEFTRGFTPYIDRVIAGETFIISAEQARAQLPPTLQTDSQLGASAVVPLRTERALQGVMTVSYRAPERDFTTEQLWTLRGIARHAALAIERARLMEEEREATAIAEALVTLGRELSATLDRRHILTRIPEMAATAAGCDLALLGFWDRETSRVRILGAYGFAPDVTEQLLALSLDTADSPFNDLVTRQGYLEIPSPQQLRGLPPGLMEQFGVSSLLAVLFGPVDERLGSVTVANRTRTGPFSPAQLRLLNGIGQQAAIALENIRLVEDLRQANRLKSDFLSTVSHELRTPLNAIIGYGDLLRERVLGPLLPDQEDATQVIGKKAEQLLELINTTLDLTRLEAGQVTLHLTEFALADVFAELQHELADESRPGVVLHVSLAPQLPPLHSDRGKLKTVIKNLVHNALKFTLQGSVELYAQPAPDPATVEVIVRDTGVGIAAENVHVIFEMFRQLEPALTRHFGGVGLGLYIVQRLLGLLNGTIDVDSAPGRGSTFRITLPIRHAGERAGATPPATTHRLA